MRIKQLFAAAALGVSALALSACATGLPTKVSRFQAMPGPAGQSFVVLPADGRNQGGLEFARYADMVTQAMAAQGYRPAAGIGDATMVVQLGYGVDQGRTEIVEDPFAYNRFDPFYRGFYGRPYYSRYRYWGPRSAFYYGWDDPFWGSRFGSGISTYTSYKSELTLNIRRKADNASLFEGRAQARSTTDNLGTLVPNLVTAMFTGFPGRSGETVRITVAPPPKA